MDAVLIREATSDDWPAIWPFLREIVAAGDTYTWPLDVAEEQARQMWLAPPPDRAVVAVDGDTVVGTAKFGANHRGPASHIGTASFMVRPGHGGKGIGRALGEHVIAELAAAGFRGIQFNAVVSTNTRAVHLWQSLGFEIIGTLPGGFNHPTLGYVDLHIMFRNL
jgi:L-amino acid N-acyltransferase YncA